MSDDKLLDAIIAQTKLTKKQTDKQQKIVETAIKLFAEKGYANTSTSEIAKAAMVAEGTIFRHYGTKDNLLLSVILPFIKDSIPTMAEEVFTEIMSKNVGCFEDFLRALLKNRLHFINENREIFQIVVKELLYNDELRKELLPFFADNILHRITKVINTYKDRGELIDIPSHTIQRMIFTLIGGYFVSRFVLQLDNCDINEEAEIENLIQFIMDGLRKQ
ncbi:TetR/AcrR family transcriptional regulator [Bacillus cihuensis]|uniref:TetR/AcrR family transcriptional regulator n=1 Tax=Bacillus cihuensis TaxID=1208599 RepID=UPI00040713DC|nr:TetR/AcrR family transcriptional regulator [Bacillus cihuensis]